MDCGASNNIVFNESDEDIEDLEVSVGQPFGKDCENNCVLLDIDDENEDVANDNSASSITDVEYFGYRDGKRRHKSFKKTNLK